MKVLHVLDRSLPEVAGYTSRAAAILEAQAALGIEVLALTSPRQASPAATIHDIVHHRTLAPALPGGLERWPLVHEVLEIAAVRRRILELSDRAGVDVVHAHSPVLWGIAGRAAAGRLGVASVYEIRAFWEDAAANQGRDREGSPRYRAIRGAETALCRASDAVVAICEGIRRDLCDRGLPEDRIFVVPNGVDTARFTPRPRDPELAARFGFRSEKIIAYVGSLFRFEGVARLLEALAGIVARRAGVRGLIVGKGETLEELRALHARLGLGDRVVLAGGVPPNEVPALYALADVLVYPREAHRITDLTTPLKPLEAMSMGKFVVGSDVGGIRELVRDGETGLLFRAGDTDALGRALLRALDDAELARRLGAQAREAMVASRDQRAIVARYLPIYAFAAHRRAQSRGLVGRAVRLSSPG